MAYRPKSNYERNLFPNLGTARITDGPIRVGETGTIIERDRQTKVVRIAFDNFWDRPNGSPADWDEKNGPDNTWCFPGEYEVL